MVFANMVKYCVAYGCKNLERKSSGIQFHSFPFKNKELLDQWTHAIRREKWKPSSSSRICSTHFTANDYLLRPGAIVRRLTPTAVPSVFNFPQHLLRNIKCRRVLIRHELVDMRRVDVDEEREGPKPDIQNEAKMREKATQTCGLKYSAKGTELCKKVKVLQQKIRRQSRKITSMRTLITELKKNRNGTGELISVLENNFKDFPLEFVLNQARNSATASNQKRYTAAMKQFALTLYFYSPKAYKFVRKSFHLPNPRTIRKWISSANCSPGFLQEVFDFLKIERIQKSYLSDCALIIDAMSIRKQLLWDKKNDKHVGYLDYAGIVDVDPEIYATEALVIQIVSCKDKFKCPIAYFLANKTSSCVQGQLLKTSLTKLHEIGIIIRSITADGTAVNLQSFNYLGCSFDIDNLTTHFKHPNNNSNVYVIFDPCHMLKLARNAMGEKNITSPTGNISWKFISNLHHIQEECDFKFANSLSGDHVSFKNKKMNVRLVAQVLNSSVADALEFLQVTGNILFENCQATVEFLRIIDRCFDMLNSKNPFESGYKAPLRMKNIEYWLPIFKETENYLKSLKIDGIPLLQHCRKTFALGFIVTLRSIHNLAVDLFQKVEPLNYFLTYKCSQDNLEIFFSLVRSAGGWNNNPNVLQFQWALRKLLFKNSVQPDVTGNCLDATYKLSTVFEFRNEKRSLCTSVAENIVDDSDSNNLFAMLDNITLSDLQTNVLYYISGFIVKKMLKLSSCNDCNKILLFCKNLEHDHSYSVGTSNYQAFTKFVNRGKLILPSEIVYKIVQFAERRFQLQLKINILMSNFKWHIVQDVVKHFSVNLDLFEPKHPQAEEHLVEDIHEVQIIKKIASFYVEMRLKTRAKKITNRIGGSRASIRQKLNHIVLFSNV